MMIHIWTKISAVIRKLKSWPSISLTNSFVKIRSAVALIRIHAELGAIKSAVMQRSVKRPRMKPIKSCLMKRNGMRSVSRERKIVLLSVKNVGKTSAESNGRNMRSASNIKLTIALSLNARFPSSIPPSLTNHTASIEAIATAPTVLSLKRVRKTLTLTRMRRSLIAKRIETTTVRIMNQTSLR